MRALDECCYFGGPYLKLSRTHRVLHDSKSALDVPEFHLLPPIYSESVIIV
eukprot:CAMPEP_0170550482 /NCGR_PEP_ID=MMETSP0211-20121228/8546_1 /TAXON_ID=311385 /ORGANISM="Pseudokeronopsis sp., Strain OXSARD2" /LENGTH=50 /DNA_ID=CAMNT_0010857061 /DNA_START=573 /DNA_END=722 /DNA_ORIENTATION=-